MTRHKSNKNDNIDKRWHKVKIDPAHQYHPLTATTRNDMNVENDNNLQTRSMQINKKKTRTRKTSVVNNLKKQDENVVVLSVLNRR